MTCGEVLADQGTRMNHVQKLSIFVLGLWTIASRADEVPLVPARLENAAEVAQLISFPDVAKEREIIIIRCGATISRRGRAWPVIYTNPEQAAVFAPYENEVRKVMNKLRAIPARANDRNVEVWSNFSVIFDNMHGTKQVRIVPNLQYDVKRYGEQYLDPQRIVDRMFPSACIRQRPVWTLSRTNAEGAALTVSITAGNAAKNCERALTNLLLESTYIPAQHDGKAVEGTYVEAWYTTL